MTREEHLEFCKKCQNRSFDSQQGVICKLTGKIADFEDNCKDYELDETVTEPILPEERSHTEVIAELPEEIKGEFKQHQNLSYAIIGGFFLSIICALIWAVVTVSTEYQIGFMAIGVGIVVGMGVRFFGAGIDMVYGLIGASFALLGCVLGNLFSQVGFAANAESIGYFQMLSFLDIETIISIFQESFSGMDLLFYGFAVFEGYKFAFRPIPAEIEERQDLTPSYASLRLPLVVISFLIISFAGYTLSKGVSGEQTFYYESGKVMSSGQYEDSKMNGIWNYFYESGEPQAIVSYENGLEQGYWKLFFEDGSVMREGNYKNGLIDGTWLNYYDNGVVSDSSFYDHGRLSGQSNVYYENGQLMRTGSYKRDLQDGLWQEFYDNGQKRSEGSYELGEQKGVWYFWNQHGKPLQEVAYLSSDKLKIINTYDKDGNVVVAKGFGTFNGYYDDETLEVTGMVKDGFKTGVWKKYHTNGKQKEEGIYENEEYKILHRYSAEGAHEIVDGQGDYMSFYEGTTATFEEGSINNGLKEGPWITYYPDSNGVSQVSDYKQGKLHGKVVVYYENGMVYTEGNYENGLKEGEWIWNYESGELQCTVDFVNNKKEGLQPFWSESGTKNKEELYKNGEFISEKIF